MLTEEELEFLDFISNTLIPDLITSGYDATAEDFERLVSICNRLDKVIESVTIQPYHKKPPII
jgi:hypothetical protein